MIRRFASALKLKDNSGSTMVEVLAGFTILVVVLVECSVHLLGAAGNMVMKAKDMQTDRQTLNKELYKKDVDPEKVEITTINEAIVTLELDPDKTDEKNIGTDQAAKNVTLQMDASVKRFESKDANLAIVHILRKTP